MSNYPNKNFQPKVTAKGTELPLMNLKGKPYLQVAHRLVWFREDYPTGTIQTEVSYDDDKCVAKATIAIPVNGVQTIVAVAHKRETAANFSDHIEKAETGAVGRALAMLGFGTQFDPELDEGDRLADSPIEPARKRDGKEGVGPKAASKNSGVRASDSSGTPAIKPGSVESAVAKPSALPDASPVGEALPESPQTKTKEELFQLIDETARIVVTKKKATMADLKSTLSTKYGVDKKDHLTVDQAAEFLQSLNALAA